MRPINRKVKVCITETLQRIIEVDVNEVDNNPTDYIRAQYCNGEIVLDAEDLIDTEFEIMNDWYMRH